MKFHASMTDEPRSMTLADVLVLSAGVALALVAPPFWAAGWMWPGLSKYSYVVLYSAWLVSQTLCLVVLARQLRFGRPIRPAEWLLFVIKLRTQGAPFDQWSVGGVAMRLAGEDGSEERWMIVLAVGCGLVILAGLAMLRALRGRIPEWLITIGLVILLYLASWGPLPVFEAEVGQRVATLGTDLTGLLGDAVLWLAKVLASLPDGLLLAVPFLASFRRDGGGARPNWVERFAQATMITLWVSHFYVDPTSVAATGGQWVGPAVGRLIDLVFQLGLAAWLVQQLGPWWRGWWEKNLAQPAGSTSSAASPASTDAT